MRLCLTLFPPDYPNWLKKGPFFYFFDRLGLFLHKRRNPRTEEYMRQLCAETFPGGYTVKDAKLVTPEDLAESKEVVLLWPDANGYGWAGVERRISREIPAGTELTVLNGRRRYFRLGRGLRFTYLVRRVLERFWIGEMLMTALFILVTPALLAWDKAKGRS